MISAVVLRGFLGSGSLTTRGFESGDGWDSGYTIDGENEVELANPYGALTVYSDGAGGFYSIGGTS